jgi:hypothetical protein
VHTQRLPVQQQPQFCLAYESAQNDCQLPRGIEGCRDGIGRRRDKRQLTACFYLNLVILLSARTQQHSNKSLAAAFSPHTIHNQH